MRSPGEHMRKVLCAWVLTFAVSAVCFAVEYTVHIVEPVINDHLMMLDGPLPPVCRQGRTMKVRACRGEYEPASFVVTASKPLAAVRIEVAPVSGPGEPWPEAAIDVRVRRKFGASPILLVHDEGFLRTVPAPTQDNPDAVTYVPTGELRDADELQPVAIEKRKQFWVTVHVPETAKAGTYSTVLKIVPENDDATTLTLEIEVYSFDLMEPMVEYSIYYPVRLASEVPPDDPLSFGNLTEEQYVAELKNMLAHGMSNPNIHEGCVKARPDGSLDFSVLAMLLDLRESVGMRPEVLYIGGHPFPFYDGELTDEQRQMVHRYVREIDDWARQRGYSEVFYMGRDEWWGEQLLRERDSMMAVDEAGGKVFVAVMHPEFFDRVGDVLHCPVLQSPVSRHVNAAFRKYLAKYGEMEAARRAAEIGGAGRFEVMIRNRRYRKAIDGAHRAGHKILTYMNPSAGVPYPDLQRRNEGLGLWRVGFDGTMTWAYTHNGGDKVNQFMYYAKVYRTENGVVDTVYWEGYREGVDDMRYLTTLYAELRSATGRFPDNPLIDETHAWLKAIDVVRGDLDAIRAEMARRIVALRDMGYKALPPEEILKGIDLDRVRIIAFPEPWRFKMDADDQGVDEKWFDPATDDNTWGTLRTDVKDKGWGNDPGFGWYRTRLPLTRQEAGKTFACLYFEACDEDAWVYLNGEEIFEHSGETTGLLISEIWLTPFVVPLNDVTLRGEDLLAVRVYNSTGMGGVWKPVHLILSDQQLTEEHVEALVNLNQE